MVLFYNIVTKNVCKIYIKFLLFSCILWISCYRTKTPLLLFLFFDFPQLVLQLTTRVDTGIKHIWGRVWKYIARCTAVSITYHILSRYFWVLDFLCWYASHVYLFPSCKTNSSSEFRDTSLLFARSCQYLMENVRRFYVKTHEWFFAIFNSRVMSKLL